VARARGVVIGEGEAARRHRTRPDGGQGRERDVVGAPQLRGVGVELVLRRRLRAAHETLVAHADARDALVDRVGRIRAEAAERAVVAAGAAVGSVAVDGDAVAAPAAGLIVRAHAELTGRLAVRSAAVRVGVVGDALARLAVAIGAARALRAAEAGEEARL